MSDESKTCRYPNLRKLALSVKIKEKPGLHFRYNNYNPILLGMILERCTGMSVSEYLQEKLWKPLGMKYPATWSTDYEENGLEKLESGLNARAIIIRFDTEYGLDNYYWPNVFRYIAEKI